MAVVTSGRIKIPPRPSKQCSYPGCTALTRDKGGRCEKHPGTWERNTEAPKRMRGRGLQTARTELFRANPFCVECQRLGRVCAATQRDHVIPLAQGGTDDAQNTQGLCDDCHDLKSQGEAAIGQWGQRRPLSAEAQERRFPSNLSRSRIPLTMVCGPPGSGKSTYLREHMSTNDILIDMDRIMQSMSGLPEHHTGRQWIAPALDERNRQLRALATETTHDQAWFVIAAPDPTERARWAAMLGAEVVVLRTSLDECVRRINADTARPANFRQRMIDNARTWWASN